MILCGVTEIPLFSSTLRYRTNRFEQCI